MSKPLDNVRRAVALALLCATCAAGARAQQAYKIEETDYARCDLSEVPHVTDLSSPVFVELGRHPEARAAVVVYSTRPGDAVVYARQIRRWLTEVRGVAAERVLAVYGGRAGKRRLEIWLVPAGAEPPRDAPPVTRVGVTLFDRYYYYGGESCPENHLPALEAFAETLKRLPGWRGRIVLRPHVNRRGARGGDTDFDPSPLTRRQALRHAAADRLRLINQLGLDPARVRAVVGAPHAWAHGELWLVPPAAAAAGGRRTDTHSRARRLPSIPARVYKFGHEKDAFPRSRARVPRGVDALGRPARVRAGRRQTEGGRAQSYGGEG